MLGNISCFYTESCFAGGVLGIEIASTEGGSLRLLVFDVHRNTVLKTDVGPTVPDTIFESETEAKIEDQHGVWWKLGFSSKDELSIFTANLSVAQDCAFSKQCMQDTNREVIHDIEGTSRMVGRDFRVWYDQSKSFRIIVERGDNAYCLPGILVEMEPATRPGMI